MAEKEKKKKRKKRKKGKFKTGFIVISETLKGERGSAGVVGLSRLSRKKGRRWIDHPTLNECFVHSRLSLMRCLRAGDTWTQRVTHVLPAIYNRRRPENHGGGYAEKIGEPMTLTAFSRQSAV
jgi:hypothetical protein